MFVLFCLFYVAVVAGLLCVGVGVGVGVASGLICFRLFYVVAGVFVSVSFVGCLFSAFVSDLDTLFCLLLTWV